MANSSQYGREPRGKGKQGGPPPSVLNRGPLLSGEEMQELTPQQAAFVAELVADPNLRRAAARAGLHPDYGADLAAKPAVRAVMALARQRLVDQVNVDTVRLLQEYIRIGFFDIRNLYHPDGRLKEPPELDDATAAAIQSIEVEEIYEWEGTGKNRKRVNTGRIVKYKMNPKHPALHDLAEHLGLLVKNVKIGGSVDVNHGTAAPEDNFWDRISLETRLKVLEEYRRATAEQKQLSVTVDGGELKKS